MENSYKRYRTTHLLVSSNYKRLQHKYRQQEVELKTIKNDLESLMQRFQEKADVVIRLGLENERLANQSQQTCYLEQLVSATILTEEDWITFRVLFEKVHPGFISEQKTLFPDLTLAETRLVVLEKLRLTTQEMARMLGVNRNTIYQTKITRIHICSA